MDLGLTGRSAIVCASSQGLGRACALELARDAVHAFLRAVDAAALALQLAGDLRQPAVRGVELALRIVPIEWWAARLGTTPPPLNTVVDEEPSRRPVS